MTKQFTLGKNERLKSRLVIEQLFTTGKKFVVAPFRIHFILDKSDKGLKFGVGVSAKNFRKAVDRNKIKRHTREAYRLQKIALQEKVRSTHSTLQLFFIYTGKELPDHDTVFKKVATILQKLHKLVDENTDVHS